MGQGLWLVGRDSLKVLAASSVEVKAAPAPAPTAESTRPTDIYIYDPFVSVVV